MKDKIQRSSIATVAFEGGQLWQLTHSHVQVELVGKTLVHYRHYTGMVKRPPILLSSKLALQKFLRRHHAFVVDAPAGHPQAIHDPIRPGPSSRAPKEQSKDSPKASLSRRR